MKYYQTLKTAMNELRCNPLREALTTLGIVLGVAAVIAMMELANGSSIAIRRTIASMGENNLLIRPGTAARDGASNDDGSTMTLAPADADAIAQQCPAVGSVAPAVRVRSTVVAFGSRNWSPAYVYGTTPAYLDVRDWTDLADGEPFTDRDVRNSNMVCLIGQTLVRELFGGESPLGREIRLQNVALTVVGVLQHKGANLMGKDQDDVVLAPWTTIERRIIGSTSATMSQNDAATSASANTLGLTYPNTAPNLYPVPWDTGQADAPQSALLTSTDQIIAAAVSSRQIPAAIQQISAVLRERHNIQPGEADDFNIRDMTRMPNAMTSATDSMTRILLGVAMISLVIGGVGIMNIMLVTVAERAKEIRQSMAAGAKSGDVLQQFMEEAIALCLIGGAVGILAGYGCSYLVTRTLHWPTALSPAAIIASLLLSAGVGIVFGYYPAWKASRMTPVEAVRSETNDPIPGMRRAA